MATDHYRTLGVPATASFGEVKRAYRRLARRWHPDINPHDPRAAEEFRRVGEAYRALCDPRSRAGFEELRFSSPPPAGPVSRVLHWSARRGRSGERPADCGRQARPKVFKEHRSPRRGRRRFSGPAAAPAMFANPLGPPRRKGLAHHLGERLRLLAARLADWLRGRPHPRLEWELLPNSGPHLILDVRLPRWLALKGTSVHLTLQEREHPLYLSIPPGVQDGTCLKVTDPFGGPRRQHLFVNILLVP